MNIERDMNSPNRPQSQTSFPSRVFKFFRKNIIFFLTVLIPTTLSAAYYGFVASDIYISESKFVIRNTEQQANFNSLGQILKGSGLTRSSDDSYTVRDYVLSRDALRELDEKANLRKIFGSNFIDSLSRYPGLDGDKTFEGFYEYYKRHVTILSESDSPVVSLAVRAFTPEDSLLINKHLLEMSETFVNRMNERARRDTVELALKEVELAQEKSRAVAEAMANFRNSEGVMDPEKQSVMPFEQITRIQEELTDLRAKLAQLTLLARSNPQIEVLQQRIKFLEREMEITKSKVVGNDNSLATKAIKYQRLLLEREFSEKMLASAMSSLELARNEAQRKNSYITIISSPVLPDDATEPKRLRFIGAVFVLGLLVWGVMSMLTAAIREHQD